MIDQFAFHDSEKRFSHRIVPTISLAGHALDKFMFIELFTEIGARILHATIRMKNKALSRSSTLVARFNGDTNFSESDFEMN
jgi:hypothetical protein